MIRRVVLIGASGVFGSRLAALLASTPDLELVLAARDGERLFALQAQLEAQGSRARLASMAFDRRAPGALRSLRPWLVIDAAGPFQEGGYEVALAAAAAGAHYIDLADGRDFVAGFPAALDAAAAQAGVLAVTGASTTPALSHAALAELTAGWTGLDKVAVAIAPGGRAAPGISAVRAVLGWVGRPVRVFRAGAWASAPGWSGMRRVFMPGLGWRWASLCETPDLDLLPQSFAIGDEAIVLAGLEPGVLHGALTLLATAVRLGALRSPARFAPRLQALARPLFRLGSDRGGMIVEAQGRDEAGRAIRARWALWAPAGSGPSTPAAPAAALVRRLLTGQETRRGALPAAGLVSLGEIMGELAGLPIGWRSAEAHPKSPALFRRLLGRRFSSLPGPVRAVHGGEGPARFRGAAIARIGPGLAARLLRALLGLPRSGRHEVEVRIVAERAGERWTRRFGAARFFSRLLDLTPVGVFEERFGPVRFRFELLGDAGGVTWTRIGWGVLALAMPAAWGPQIRARATARAGAYRFRVAVGHPWLGLLFAYRGRLQTPDERPARPG